MWENYLICHCRGAWSFLPRRGLILEGAGVACFHSLMREVRKEGVHPGMALEGCLWGVESLSGVPVRLRGFVFRLKKQKQKTLAKFIV
jgi:hypothetical protein